MILVLWPKTYARSVRQGKSFPFRLFLRHFQSFLSPKTFDSFVIYVPAFRPQQGRLLGAQAVLVRVFPGYNFAAGSFAKGEPEPGI